LHFAYPSLWVNEEWKEILHSSFERNPALRLHNDDVQVLSALNAITLRAPEIFVKTDKFYTPKTNQNKTKTLTEQNNNKKKKLHPDKTMGMISSSVLVFRYSI